ncbi:hypothetical protein B7486_26045 [cyanobacterium TDX16]|nr:hypothetical protein B7486_26045 [cyanobacterium TDX16]
MRTKPGSLKNRWVQQGKRVSDDGGHQMERRREIRTEADEVIRWKRPGRIEDHRAWTVDNSPSGLGFLTHALHALTPGDELHLRRKDDGMWAPLDRNVRIARITPTSSPELVLVGCSISDKSEPGAYKPRRPW